MAHKRQLMEFVQSKPELQNLYQSEMQQYYDEFVNDNIFKETDEDFHEEDIADPDASLDIWDL